LRPKTIDKALRRNISAERGDGYGRGQKVWADSPEAALEVAEHQARERTGILDCKAAQVASAPEVEARFWQGTRPREEQAEAETLALQTNALAGQNRKGPRRLVIRALPDPDTDGPAGEDRP